VHPPTTMATTTARRKWTNEQTCFAPPAPLLNRTPPPTAPSIGTTTILPKRPSPPVPPNPGSVRDVMHYSMSKSTTHDYQERVVGLVETSWFFWKGWLRRCSLPNFLWVSEILISRSNGFKRLENLKLMTVTSHWCESQALDISQVTRWGYNRQGNKNQMFELCMKNGCVAYPDYLVRYYTMVKRDPQIYPLSNQRRSFWEKKKSKRILTKCDKRIVPEFLTAF